MRPATRWIVGLIAGFSLGCAQIQQTFAPRLWDQPPPPTRDGAVVRAGALTRAEFANGIRVLVLEDQRVPRVAVTLSVRRGAASVAPERAGLAAFTSELMKRGAGGRDALALAQSVDRLGARLSVGSGWDETGAGVSGLARDTDALLEILADVILRPRFDESEADKARAQQLAGLARAQDSPGTLAAWELARVLYPGHRFGISRSGSIETVERLAASDAREYHRRFFVPNDAIITASGALDPAEILRKLEGLFGDWAVGEVVPIGAPPFAASPRETRVVIVDRPDLRQTTIRLAHEGIARTEPTRIHANLLNSVLGGSGFSSRLMTVLRSKEGLTYGVASGFSLRRHPGPFGVSTSTRVSETRRVIDGILDELRRIRSEPPSELELAAAKALAVGSFALSLETSDAVIGGLADLEVHGLPEDGLDTFRTRVRATQVADLAAVARGRIHPERMAIVVVGPGQELQEQLTGLGPIELVTP